MLAIKLQRIGKKHQPSYRVVVAEKRSKLQGPPVADLGSYNGFTKKAALNKERAGYWLKVGAHPTATMHNLLVHEGVLQMPKKQIKTKKVATKAVVAPVEAAPIAEAEALQEKAE